MKTLKEICDEVGKNQFNKWIREAEKHLTEHPAFWNRADARKAFIYEEIQRHYSNGYITGMGGVPVSPSN